MTAYLMLLVYIMLFCFFILPLTFALLVFIKFFLFLCTVLGLLTHSLFILVIALQCALMCIVEQLVTRLSSFIAKVYI